MTRVSVAMAVYNGGKYLNEQMGSIVNQLSADDELIISDNMSTDDSREIILSYFKLYPNIKIIECNEQSIVANFENAIRNCTGDYIFLADQDDVWSENKIEKVLQEFADTDADLILHDCEYVNENLVSLHKTLFQEKHVKPGLNRNLMRGTYQGCCMAFKKEWVPMILPMPVGVTLHDQWIGALIEAVGKVDFFEEKLILHRKHKGSNSTKRRSLVKRIHVIKEIKKEIKNRANRTEK